MVLYNLKKSPGTYSHWSDWSCVFMVWSVVWNALVTLVLKLGVRQSHTNPINWEREENQFPRGIPKTRKMDKNHHVPQKPQYHNTLYISLHYNTCINSKRYSLLYSIPQGQPSPLKDNVFLLKPSYTLSYSIMYIVLFLSLGNCHLIPNCEALKIWGLTLRLFPFQNLL